MAIALGSNATTWTFGGQSELTSSGVLTVTPANLTADGKTLFRDVTLPVALTNLGIDGKSIGDWGSSAWQYINVTNVSLFGSEVTLFDSLSGVTPAVGDKWRIPTFSSDGGQVTGFGNGRFSVSSPTSGQDTLPNVLYFDTSAGTWLGPETLTIQEPDTDLAVSPISRLGSRGKVIEWNLTRDLTPAATNLSSYQIRIDRLYPLTGGVTATGRDINLDGGLPVIEANLTASGQTIDLLNQLTLQVQAGGAAINSQDITRAITYLLTQAGIAIDGKNIQLYTTSYPVDQATTALRGKSILLYDDANPLTLLPVETSANGREITINTVVASDNRIAAIILGP